MKSSLSILFIFLFATLTAQSPSDIYQQSFKSKVQILHFKKFDWLVSKNTDYLSTLLHDDIHYIHSNGWKETKDELIHNITSGKLTYHSVKVHESDVRIEGNTGIVTGKGIFNVALDGKTIEINLYYTEVYIISHSGIKLLSRHACKL